MNEFSLEEVKEDVLGVFKSSSNEITVASIAKDLNYKYPKYLIARAFWILCQEGICELNRTKMKLRKIND